MKNQNFRADLLNDKRDFCVERLTYYSSNNIPQPHYHDHYEILYVMSGKRKLVVSDAEEYVLSSDCIALIRPYMLHYTDSYGEENQTRIMLNISQQFVDEISNFFDPSLLKCFNQRCIRLNEKVKEIVVRELLRLSENNEKAQTEYLNKLGFANIMCELSRCSAEYNDPDLDPRSTNRIREIMRYIRENPTEDLSLETIAAKNYVSCGYLSRSFKKITGWNINRYVTYIRIITAKKLLRNNDLSISQVAELSGFSTLNHFDKMFKKNCGITPKQFQRQWMDNDAKKQRQIEEDITLKVNNKG